MSDAYECDGCGVCCRGKLVDVFEVDVLREPRISEKMLALKEPGFDGEIAYLNCMGDGSCAFLDGENRCGIYPTRPTVCVLFPAGGKQCQEVRQAAGLPPLERRSDPATG